MRPVGEPVCVDSSSADELWAAAQVGFRDQKQVRKIIAVKRVNDVVNRLNRSKREAFPDLAAERDMFEKEVRSGACVDEVAALGGRSCVFAALHGASWVLWSGEGISLLF